jgi:NAD(P)H-nitrite reductase large subunit
MKECDVVLSSTESDSAMFKPIVFDVFGKRIQAMRTHSGWELFEIGNEGKQRRFGGAIVPSDLSEDQLLSFLDDVFHQYATPIRSRVRRID